VHNGIASLECLALNRTVAGACSTPNREARMSFILAIMAVPFLTATGIYNPPVMQHGHCIARPGSFDALYCSAPAATPHRQARKHAKR
jgi:hypothetical protein